MEKRQCLAVLHEREAAEAVEVLHDEGLGEGVQGVWVRDSVLHGLIGDSVQHADQRSTGVQHGLVDQLVLLDGGQLVLLGGGLVLT